MILVCMLAVEHRRLSQRHIVFLIVFGIVRRRRGKVDPPSVTTICNARWPILVVIKCGGVLTEVIIDNL